MHIKTFFLTDIDGTLLKTGLSIHRSVIDEIDRFVSYGHYFSLSTGRAVCAVRDIVSSLPINAPCILCSGALIYDFAAERALWEAPLDGSVIALIENILQIFPDVSITAYTPENIYNLRTNSRLLQRGVLEDRTAPIARVDDIKSTLIKLLLTCDSKETLEYIGTDYVDLSTFEYHAASRHFYELTAKGVTKGTASELLCSLLSENGQIRLFAAGDAHSDLTMRKTAEEFFAPITAPQSVKDYADHIFPSPEEGGLATALRYALDKNT